MKVIRIERADGLCRQGDIWVIQMGAKIANKDGRRRGRKEEQELDAEDIKEGLAEGGKWIGPGRWPSELEKTEGGALRNMDHDTAS